MYLSTQYQELIILFVQFFCRTTRGSFDRAVDGSYDNATPTGEEEQRGMYI